MKKEANKTETDPKEACNRRAGRGPAAERLQSSSAESRALLDLFERLTPLTTPDEMSKCFLDTFSGLLAVARSAVYIRSFDENLFELKHSIGIIDAGAISSIRCDSSFAGWLGRAGGPVLIDSYFKAPGVVRDAEMDLLTRLTGLGLSHALAIRTLETYSGILFFGGKGSGGVYSVGGEGFIGMLARTLAVCAEKCVKAACESVQSRNLDEFSRAKKEFVARNCRDIRTPLSVLKSTLCSVNPGDLGESVLIDMAKDAASRMESRLEQLLSVCDIEAAGTVLEAERSDLSAIVEDCLREFIPEFEEKGLRVEIDDRTAGKELYLDAVKMKMVVRNMVDHAVESEGRDGTIRLCTFVSDLGPDEEKRGSHAACGGWVVMRISHDGEGKDMQRTRTQAGIAGSSAAEENLTGYAAPEPDPGLILAYNIVKAHGGKMILRDRPEGKAECSIWLPAPC